MIQTTVSGIKLVTNKGDTMKANKETNETSDVKEKPMNLPSHVFVREVPVGAIVNGIPLKTTEGAARSDYQNACIGFEVGTTPLFGNPSREGGSRMYFKICRNRGDVKFLPVSNDSGDIIGFEVVGSGDDAVISLATAIIAGGEILQEGLKSTDTDNSTSDNDNAIVEDVEASETVRDFLSRIQQKLFTGQTYWIRICDLDEYEHLSFWLCKDTDFDQFNNVFDQQMLDAYVNDWYDLHDEDGYTIHITADIVL